MISIPVKRSQIARFKENEQPAIECDIIVQVGGSFD